MASPQAVRAQNASDRSPETAASLKCLSLPELIVGILEYLSTGDLYSSAQVCKAWSDLAVPTLWRVHPIQLKNLLDLIGLSPQPPEQKSSDSKEVETEQDVVTYLWDRFIFISENVQTLFVAPEFCSGTFLRTLSDSLLRHDNRILPNLRSVTILSTTGKDTVGVDASNCQEFLEILKTHSPNLTAIALPVHTGSITFNFDTFPNLRSLYHAGTMALQSLNSIIGCTKLELISLTEFSLDATSPTLSTNTEPGILSLLNSTSVATMPSVKFLELGSKVSVDEEEENRYEGLIWSKLSFPSLKRISIVGSNKKNLTWIRRLLQESERVTGVSVEFRAFRRRWPDPQVLRCLSSYNHLKQIRLVGGSLSGNMLGDGSLVEWLASMHHLEAFEWTLSDSTEAEDISIDGNFLDFEEVLAIVYGHPTLRELALPLKVRYPEEFLGKARRSSLASKERKLESTSVKSLELFALGLKLSNIESLAEILVELLPDTIELTLRAHRYYFRMTSDEEIRNTCAKWIKRLRTEKRKGGKKWWMSHIDHHATVVSCLSPYSLC